MKIISSIFALIFSASVAAAGSSGHSRNYATIIEVNPVYVNNYVERYDNVCHNVQVPVYGYTNRGNSGDVLIGAIIGGAVGNQFGSGSGQDAMTVLGAIIGANRAANRPQHVVSGYRVEQHCNTVRSHVNEPIVSHYYIKYVLDGVIYSEETKTFYTVGQNVKVGTSLK